MARIIHPEPEEVVDAEAVDEALAYRSANFQTDESTENHLDNLFIAETEGETHWRQEEQRRRALHDHLVAELDIPVPPELLKQKKAQGKEGERGKKLDFIPWYTVAARLNEYFGHDGWTTEVRKIETFGAEGGNPPKFVAAVVVLTVRWPHGGTSTFTNTGTAVTAGSYWGSFEMAYKGAVSDGLTRCAKLLGDAFGLTLYNKDDDAPETETTSETTTPTPIRRKVEYPIATEDDVAECENCGKEIKGYTNNNTGKTYTTAQLVAYSKRDTDGKTLCYSCKQDYMKAK